MAEFPELDPEDEHTPESLEAKLQEYRKAIESEYTESKSGEKPEENAEQFSIDFAKENLAHNLAQLQWLAQNAMSEGVRVNASKFLVQLAREDAKADGDPIKVLLAKLTKKDTATTT